MNSIRWKLWEYASWIAFWLCPDKKALALIQKHGTVVSRMALDQAKNERASKEGSS